MTNLSMWCVQVAIVGTPWSRAGSSGCAPKRKDALKLASTIMRGSKHVPLPRLKVRVVRRTFNVETSPHAARSAEQKYAQAMQRAEVRSRGR